MEIKNTPWQAISLDEWLNSEEFKKGQSLSAREFVELWFNRMPIRATYINPKWIYAPFDGIVTHIGLYDPDKDVFDIKGKSYTINEVLDSEIKCKCYCCGIFLTAFSVHLGRFPVNGIIRKTYELPPITTTNLSMIPAEYDLFSKKINPENLQFAKKNQCKVIEIFDTKNKMNVIVVSIADREVDSILDFKTEDEIVRQGQRMQFVCWGSYALIIILKNRRHIKLETCVKQFNYVYAGKTVVFKFAQE